MDRAVREDLAQAHRAAMAHAVAPGARFDGEQRRRIAEVAIAAFLDPDPPPPWVRPYGDAALDVAHRVARHASTITQAWYDELTAGELDPLDWVEIVGVVVSVVAPTSFARAAGLPLPDVPPAQPGALTGNIAADLAPATLNFVPVAAPADQVASVVQALSALPDEWSNMWRLADVQYMSNEAMADPRWTRGTLSRPQTELVAGRLSLVRECFF